MGKKYSNKEVEKIVEKAVRTALKGKTSSKGTKNKENKQREKSLRWWKRKHGLSPVKTGLKVILPTKHSGEKEYDAVELNNGKVAVFVKGGYLKYAWADIK